MKGPDARNAASGLVFDEVLFPLQRRRVDSQRWKAEEDVAEGDLGLGNITQLDICTGTAACSRAGDQASSGIADPREGGERGRDPHLVVENLYTLL